MNVDVCKAGSEVHSLSLLCHISFIFSSQSFTSVYNIYFIVVSVFSLLVNTIIPYLTISNNEF
jgi:hypothetical protein